MEQAHEIEGEDSEAGGLARLGVANALGSANISKRWAGHITPAIANNLQWKLRGAG